MWAFQLGQRLEELTWGRATERWHTWPEGYTGLLFNPPEAQSALIALWVRYMPDPKAVFPFLHKHPCLILYILFGKTLSCCSGNF